MLSHMFSKVAVAQIQAQMTMPMTAPDPSISTMPMSAPMGGEMMMVMAPQWVTLGLGIAFLVGTLFYLLRLCRPAYLKRINGYADGENEFWHGLCLLAMTASLTPALVPLPVVVWLWILPVAVLWYLYRAFTYGRKLTYNKQWYDFAHAAMFFGMWWMFARPLSSPLVTVLFAAYWSWFGSYYGMRLVKDFKRPHWLSLGQDLFHFTMAVVMVIMTIWPNYLMIM